ncbi:prepilin-type N-terminal cleavage/methylation domain-containing protein [Opitutaceae bacterium TAV4]|nr:prepilin-type N-terminal cleavage/methylation domain-containing protein [Opitutaceae bacterium TAV4]RRJ99955.1 prepilin-type N-terminal cleavage/methylation domain-containing protein [Opitutaceae bacterium TAV3]
MTAPFSKHSAFTLIELLTVIAIIGILAAIIIPVVGKVRDTARTAQCISNWRQWDTAIKLHINDNKDRFPITINPPPAPNAPTKEPWYQIAPYLGIPGTSPMPAAAGYDKIKTIMYGTMACTTKYNRPYRERNQALWWTFGISDQVSGRPYGSLTAPSRTLLGIDHCTESPVANILQWFERKDYETNPLRLRTASPKPHVGKVNVLYADGHVRTLRASQIMIGDHLRADPTYDGSKDNDPIGDPAYDQ